MASEEVNNIKAEVSLVGSGLKMTIRREKPVVDSLPSNTEWISETRGNGLGKLVLKRKSGSVTASPSSGVISSSCSPGVKKVEPGERNIIRLSFISSPEDGSQIAQIKQLSSSSCDITSDEGVGELSPACHLQPSPKDSGIDVSSPPHDDGHVVNYGQIVTVNGCDTEQNNTGVLDRLTVDRTTSDVSTECLPVSDSESLYYSGASELKSWEQLSKVQSTLRTKAERTAEPVPAANGCRERRIFKSRQRNTNGSTPAVPVYCSAVYTVSSIANSNRKRRLAPDESSTYNLPPKKHSEKVVERVILKIKQGSIVAPSAKSVPKDVAGKKGRSSNKDAIKLTVAKVSKSSVDESGSSGNTAVNVTENKESTVDGCVKPENESHEHVPRLTTKIRVADMKKSVSGADDGHVFDVVSRKRKNKESKTSRKSSGVNRNVSCRDPLSLPKVMDPPIVDSNASITHTSNRTVENGDVLFDTTLTRVENVPSSCNTVSGATLLCTEQLAVIGAFIGERVSSSAVEREIGPSEGCPAYNYESSSALQHCDPGGTPAFSRVEGSPEYNSSCTLNSPVVCREMELTSCLTSEVPLKAVCEQGGPVVHCDNVELHNDSNNSVNCIVTNLSVSCIHSKGQADADCKKKLKEPPGGIRKRSKFSAMRSSVEIPCKKLSTDYAACKVESKNSQLSPDHVDCRTIAAFQHSAVSVRLESSVNDLSENVPSAVASEKSNFWSTSVEAVEQSAAEVRDRTSHVQVLNSSKPLDASNEEQQAGLCKTFDKASSQDTECLPTCLPLLSSSGSHTLTLEDAEVDANKSDSVYDIVTSVAPASQVVSCSNAGLTEVVSMNPAASCTDEILTIDTRTAALSDTADSVESIADDSLLLLKNSQVKVADSSTLFGPLRIESHVDKDDESVMVQSNVQAGISPSLSVASTKSLSPVSSGCNNIGKGGFMTEFAKFVHTTFDTKKEVDEHLEIDEKLIDDSSIWMIDMDSHRSEDLHSTKLLPASEVRNSNRVSSGPKSRSIRGRKMQRTAVSKTIDQRSKSDSYSRRRAERSSLTNLDVNSFMPDHCRLVDLRCKTCDMLRAVFPSLKYPAGFCRESKSVDELIEQILLILNQPTNKTAGISRSEPCSEPFVDICSLPEQCMNRLRRQILRLMTVLLPGIDLSDIDDIESIEVLLEMITSANAVTPNLAGATADTSAKALLSLPGTWPVSLIPVQKPDISPHCLDVKPEVNGVLQSTFGYISITPNPSFTKRTLKRQVKDCLMFLDKDLT